ncbi:MAG TPA: isoaspartyl peptidase/L-asparaginase, partial [Caulobacteraceae bacterium]|nr:isoaspartyl peptidase/L-asparaginase [Caulobacteraceae bacterium]
MAKFALALHGGAGAKRGADYSREIPHMQGLVEAARDRLAAGASALDVAVETVRGLEDSGLYVAGRGASPNTAGDYELDASIMTGPEKHAGAVAALQGFRNPVEVARLVLEKTPHVMLAGAGAAL